MANEDGLLTATFRTGHAEAADLHWQIFRTLAASTRCHFACGTRLSTLDIDAGLPSQSVSSYNGRVYFGVSAGILGRGMPGLYQCMALGEDYRELAGMLPLAKVSEAHETSGGVQIFRVFDSTTDEAGWEARKARVLEISDPRVFWSLEGGLAPEFFRQRISPLDIYTRD